MLLPTLKLVRVPNLHIFWTVIFVDNWSFMSTDPSALSRCQYLFSNEAVTSSIHTGLVGLSSQDTNFG